MEKTGIKNSHIMEGKSLPLHPAAILAVLYILGVSVRFVLSFFFRTGPTLTIDESLYISLAQSLAAGEGIAYRSQPIPYMYIFYPLLLAPLYWFPLPFDLYRVVQFWNALLITTSVFPAYLLAKAFTGDRRKALLASALTLLMPDMQMSGYLMAESAVWPLALWLMFFSCRLFIFEEKRIFNAVMTGVFAALLFWTKPGSLVMGFAVLIAALLLGEKRERKERRPAVLVGLCVCAAMILLFYSLYIFVFGYQPSLLGLYNKQLTDVSSVWFAAVAEFSALQLILFAVACGGVFFAVPYACCRRYNSSQKSFLTAFSIGLIFLAAGTAAFVDMFHWNGSFINPQLHLRYMAMYVPVMVVFSLGVPWEKSKNTYLAVMLAVIALFLIYPGASAGFVEGDFVDGTSTSVDSLALSGWLKSNYIPPYIGVFLTVLCVCFLLFLSWRALRGRSSSLVHNLCIGFFVLVLLVHNVSGYIAGNVGAESYGYGSDAVEMNKLLEELPGDTLIVTQQHYDEILSYGLEARLRKPCQQVTVDAFIKSLSETGGVYTPFVPEDLSPNVGNHLTPDADAFLFGVTVADHLEFSPFTDTQLSSEGWYTLAQVSEGRRLLDSALYGMDTHTLHKNEYAQLFVFDENRYQNGRLTLSLLACAKEGPVNLSIENAGRTQKISLSSEPFEYKISLRPGETILKPDGGDAMIFTYRTD